VLLSGRSIKVEARGFDRDLPIAVDF